MDRPFDTIVLASVIQYFPDLPNLLQALRGLLRPGGEIHLVDSPLYPLDAVPAARERTQAYYTSLGFPEMANHYYHHPEDALVGLPARWLYLPGNLSARLSRWRGRDASPFPWIVIYF